MARKPTGRPRGRPPVESVFTPGEERVLELLREGKNNAEIGVRLGITPDGAKYHISNMLSKTGLSSRDQLARWRPRATREPSFLAGFFGLPLAVKLGGAVTAAAVAGAFVAVPLLRSEFRKESTEGWATGLVTAGYDGSVADGESQAPVISADGRYVVYTSSATNLVPGDTNGVEDVFRFDRKSGETVRVSVGWDGSEADGASFNPSVSEDGRFIAFDSQASNLVRGDINSVRSLATEALLSRWRTRLVQAEGFDPKEIGPDSLIYLAGPDVFVRDMESGSTELVSVSSSGTQGDLVSTGASISGDGRYVAFASLANNLVSGDMNRDFEGTDGLFRRTVRGWDVFVRDRTAGTTRRVSLTSLGGEAHGNSMGSRISADGRYVLFTTDATDIATQQPSVQTQQCFPERGCDQVSIPGDAFVTVDLRNSGRVMPVVQPRGMRIPAGVHGVALVNGEPTLLLSAIEVQEVDGESGTVTDNGLFRVNVASGELAKVGSWPAHFISSDDDGRFVATVSGADGALTIHDLRAGTTETVTVNAPQFGDRKSIYRPALSNARAVAFEVHGTEVGRITLRGDIYVETW